MAIGPAGDSPPPDLIELGRLRGAFGTKGWSHVEPFAADGEVLRGARTWWLIDPHADASQARAVRISAVKRHGAALVAKWEGCDSPEAADRLKAVTVAVPRSAFPPAADGEVYWVDLIGANVVGPDGGSIGTVQALRNHGAQDLLVVNDAAGEFLIPLIEPYVLEVDVAARQIRVDWQRDWS